MILLIGMFCVVTAAYVLATIGALLWAVARAVAAGKLRSIIRARRGEVAVVDMQALKGGVSQYPKCSYETLFVHIDNLFAAYLLDGVVVRGARTGLKEAAVTLPTELGLELIVCHWRDSDAVMEKRVAHLLGVSKTTNAATNKADRKTERKALKQYKTVKSVLALHSRRFSLDLIHGP